MPKISRCQLLAGWNNNDVQSVGGGLLVEGSQLLIYGSGRMGLPFDPTWTGGNSSMGLATLRRDGELLSLCVSAPAIGQAAEPGLCSPQGLSLSKRC